MFLYLAQYAANLLYKTLKVVNFVVWFNFLKLPRQHEILLWFCWGPKIGVSDYSLIPAGGDTNDMKSWKEGLLSDNKKDFHKYLRILSPCFYLKCQQEFQYIILKSSEGKKGKCGERKKIFKKNHQGKKYPISLIFMTHFLRATLVDFM